MTEPPIETRRMLLRFAPMIYGPTLLFGLGEGALLPLLPVIAAGLGADVAQAALVATVLVVARLIGNLPAGWAVARIGERWTMGIAGLVALAGVLGVIFAPSLGILSVSVFGIGLCAAAFGLARHAFMTTRVPIVYRARALSVLGGSFRLGMFLGPFIAAGLLAVTDSDLAAAWFFVGCLVALILLVLFGRDPEEDLAAEGSLPRRDAKPRIEDDLADDTGESTTGAIPTAERQGVFRTMWLFRGLLARLGLSAAALSGIRQARVYLLPLWGLSLGLDAQAIALVIGITGALEFALFYSSGQIMDRWGRLWAALPSMVLMSGAFLGLAFTHDLDHRDRLVHRGCGGDRHRQWPVERHPDDPRRRCGAARRPGAVPRIVADADGCRRRGRAAHRLRRDRGRLALPRDRDHRSAGPRRRGGVRGVRAAVCPASPLTSAQGSPACRRRPDGDTIRDEQG